MKPHVGIQLAASFALIVGTVWSSLSAADSALAIPLPEIPERIFDITNFGAVTNGRTLNTEAIQKTIDAAEQAGGGTVLIPAGQFISGPVKLQGNIRLYLAKGARFVMSDNFSDFPIIDNGRENFISAADTHDIGISGEGVIDGQGQPWWKAFRAKELTTRRPQMIVFANCERVEIGGIRTLNPPNTHCSLRNCRNVIVKNVTMTAPADSPNTDALNISGADILITNCDISTGDDNIVFLGSRNSSSSNLKTENITVINCKLGFGHGLSIGSFTTGGVRHLRVENVSFDGTTSGIRMKAGRMRGGVVEDLVYKNIRMKNVKNPIWISSYYPKEPNQPSDDLVQPVNDKTPVWKNIVIENADIEDAANAMTVWGLPECPVSGIELRRIKITSNHGAKIYNAKDVNLTNVQINSKTDPPLTVFNAEVKGMKGMPLEKEHQPKP